MKKLLLIAIIFLFCINSFSQTCIIVAIEKETITIGADSKIASEANVYAKGAKKGKLVVSKACKIQNVGNVFCTGAGMGLDRIFYFFNKQSVFNEQGKTAIALPLDVIKKILENDLEKDRLADRKLYQKEYKDTF